jgi:hypothetical protein
MRVSDLLRFASSAEGAWFGCAASLLGLSVGQAAVSRCGSFQPGRGKWQV